jgi:hypothetical protein
LGGVFPDLTIVVLIHAEQENVLGIGVQVSEAIDQLG